MSNSKTPPSSSSNSLSSAADRDPIFSDNIFSSSSATANSEPFDLDSIYSAGSTASSISSKPASDLGPVFDKPVYDDDIFDGVTGLKSNVNDEILSSVTSPPKRGGGGGFDDLLGGFGKAKSSSFSSKKSERTDFDDFLPGFGGGSSPAPAER